MKLIPKVEADHISWIVDILTKAVLDDDPCYFLVNSARIKSALQHAEILKRSMTADAGSPFLLTIVPFGAHAGRPWEDVPSSYLLWICKQDGIGEDEQHTARHHLELRGETV